MCQQTFTFQRHTTWLFGLPWQEATASSGDERAPRASALSCRMSPSEFMQVTRLKNFARNAGTESPVTMTCSDVEANEGGVERRALPACVQDRRQHLASLWSVTREAAQQAAITKLWTGFPAGLCSEGRLSD